MRSGGRERGTGARWSGTWGAGGDVRYLGKMDHLQTNHTIDVDRSFTTGARGK